MAITEVQSENLEGGGGGGGAASGVTTDTASFNGVLSSSDDTAQKCFDTIDNMSIGGAAAIQNKYQENIFLEISAPNTIKLNSKADLKPKIEINGTVYTLNSPITLNTIGYTPGVLYDIYARWNGSAMVLHSAVCSPTTTPWTSAHPGVTYTKIGCLFYDNHPVTLINDVLAIDTWSKPTNNSVYSYINNYAMLSVPAWYTPQIFKVPVFRPSQVKYTWVGTMTTANGILTTLWIAMSNTVGAPGCGFGWAGQINQTMNSSHHPTPQYLYTELLQPGVYTKYAVANLLSSTSYVDININIDINPV